MDLADDGLTVFLADTETFHVRYLCICTGLHVLPQIPTIPGIQHISSHPDKEVIHSSSYKKTDQLVDKKVLILGTGETGMDLAYAAVKAGAKEVFLCTRGGFLSFPKALNNFSFLGATFDSPTPLPIDTLITNLFESSYVHRWVAESRLRWFVSDFVIKRVLWVLTGTSAGCNQWVGELPAERLGRVRLIPLLAPLHVCSLTLSLASDRPTCSSTSPRRR